MEESGAYLLNYDVKRLTQNLGKIPPSVERPAFIVLSGLPGTGKSYFSRQIAQYVPLVILESDALRKILFPNPTYAQYESARLFRAIHIIIEELLKKGVSILLDSTNLSERNRKTLYNIAERVNAIFIIVRLKASDEVVHQRLENRVRSHSDKSDANWEVYRRMKNRSERIKHKHYIVDTGKNFVPIINKIVTEIENERSLDGN